MTETTEFNTEQGTCIGCRLPWNGESVTRYCRNAVLVIADDTGMEVTEILLPVNKDEQKNLAETEISTGQAERGVLTTPLEQSTLGGQIISTGEWIPKKHTNREETKKTTEQPTPGGQRTPTEQEIPITHANRVELEITTEQPTPGGQRNSVEPENSTELSNRENQGVAEEPDIPVKPAAPNDQMPQAEPEIHSGPEIIIGVRI